MRGLAAPAWIPLLLVAVWAVSGLIVMRLHKVFGSQDLNANAGAAIAIGLLLDTLIVRSLLMPSIATLLGRWSWWPQVVYPRGDHHRRQPPTQDTHGHRRHRHRRPGSANAPVEHARKPCRRYRFGCRHHPSHEI
jgi:uncharacterized membrane protein YdfJ with MMPL/SSD domain